MADSEGNDIVDGDDGRRSRPVCMLSCQCHLALPVRVPSVEATDEAHDLTSLSFVVAASDGHLSLEAGRSLLEAAGTNSATKGRFSGRGL